MVDLWLHGFFQPLVDLNSLIYYSGCFLVLWTITLVESFVTACNFLSSLSFDKPKLMLFSPAEEWILEDQHLIILLDLVKVIHIQLHTPSSTCLTNDEKLECLKYLGSISLVKLTTSITMNPMSSLSQQMIFLFSGCFLPWRVLQESNMFWEGRRRSYRCISQYFYAAAPSSSNYNRYMANLGLTIRIPKESLIKLGDLQGKLIVVKFNGGREVCGKLKSWDKTMNLIME